MDLLNGITPDQALRQYTHSYENLTWVMRKQADDILDDMEQWVQEANLLNDDAVNVMKLYVKAARLTRLSRRHLFEIADDPEQNGKNEVDQWIVNQCLSARNAYHMASDALDDARDRSPLWCEDMLMSFGGAS